MLFRKPHIEDLKTLNAISIKSKQYWGYPMAWVEKWKNELTLDDHKLKEQNILLVEVDSKVIGFCSIVEKPENYEILHLWILPDHIGKGIGKKLLSESINSFTYDTRPIIVEADPNAEPFYRSQGFITFEKIESFPPGRFLPVMKRDPKERGK
ncbi:MAG: GNAT family N-acetyltransferase [Bacteroidota bacterium]